MPRVLPASTALLGAIFCLFASPLAEAGMTIYEDGDKRVEVGGRVQLQYVRHDVDGGPTTDDIAFRRLRAYLDGTVTRDWIGRIQIDFGKAVEGDEVAVKDAYMRYTGWDNLNLTIGNSKTPFSREYLTSSKRQQTVERGFVGNHNYGTPDRQMGVQLSGSNADKTVTFAAAVGAEYHDPDASKMDFDSPANNKSDWNEGVVLAGRVDFHPWGFVRFDQGDFTRAADFKANFSVAAFTWSNDDDNNIYTNPLTTAPLSSTKADLDNATGVELSAGLRGRGVSIDAELQRIDGETVDSAFTGGLYRNGSTDLDKLHVEGGYMLPGNKWELVAAYDTLDADNYTDSWDGIELGANYFWNQHKTKVQLTYRADENVDGTRGLDADTIYVQWQFVF